MCIRDSYPLTLNLSGNHVNVTDLGDGAVKIETLGGDPYVQTSTLGKDINAATGSIILRFQYKSNHNISNAQFFFCAPHAAGGQSTPENVVLKKATAVSYTHLDVYKRQAMAYGFYQNLNKAGGGLAYKRLNSGISAAYGYDDRYLVKFDLGYSGSEQYSRQNRFTAFPAVSAAWVASNEGFLENSDLLTYLKLRGCLLYTSSRQGVAVGRGLPEFSRSCR